MKWADPHRTMKVRANADIPRDAIQARAFGAEGIGLCRTEHMFFGAEKIPHMRAMILADNEKDRRTALKKLLPMQRADFAGVFKAMDGDLGAYIRAAIAKTDVIAMENIWDQGFRQMTSSTKPLLTPADLEGFKIRVPVSPLWTSMFKAFGASPISINSSEMYSALQTKIAEGQETPLVSIWSLKFYEVQKQLSLTNHMWDGIWFLANKRAWAKLPDDVRTIAAKHINEAALDQRKDIDKLNNSLRQKLEQKGMVFHEVDREAFRDKLRKAGFFTGWKKTFGDEAWAVLEKYAGNIS